MALDRGLLNIDMHCPKCTKLLKNCGCLGAQKPKPSRRASSNQEMTGLQEFLNGLGNVFVAILAVGCGVSISAAFVTLALVTAGTGSYILAAVLFGAGTLMNWYIYKNAVPQVLVSFFGKETLFQGLFEVPGGCELLYSDAEPKFDKLRKLDIKANSAYVRWQDKLYYVNKQRKECIELCLSDPAIIAAFDAEMDKQPRPPLNKARVLSYLELQQVTAITGHALLSGWKKLAMVVGLFLAIAVGIAQAVLTFGGTFTLSHAFSFLAAISPAFPPLAGILAGVTLVCLTALMINNIADWVKREDVWGDFKSFCWDLFDMSPRCELLKFETAPEKDKIDDLPLDSTAAYIYSHEKFYYVNKETKECKVIDLQPCLVPHIYKEFVKLKNESANGKEPSFEQIQRMQKLLGQKPISVLRTIAVRVLTTLLTLIALPLAALGVYMTMNASAAGTKAFLLKTIPQASAAIVDFVSKVISLGLAFLGRIPFTFRNTIRILGGIFKKGPDDSTHTHADNRSLLAKVWDGFISFSLNVLCVLNAAGNGLISMVGGGTAGTPIGWGIFGAGTWNSYTAGKSNINNAAAANKSVAHDDSFIRGALHASKKELPTSDSMPELNPATPSQDVPKHLLRAKSTLFSAAPSGDSESDSQEDSPTLDRSLSKSRSCHNLAVM